MAGKPADGGFAIHPMDQFKLDNLFGEGAPNGFADIFMITNQTLWIFLAVAASWALLALGSRGRAMVPSRSQSVAEVIYGFVRKMVEDVAGKDALPYFPYIMTAFMFILMSNVLGLLPYSYTNTSQIAVTGVLALLVFGSVTAIGFIKHGLGFMGLFWVSGAPTVALRLVLFVIEVISYFVRPLSHSIRLGGNLMAGHAVLKVFAGFAGALGLGAIAPIFAMVAVYGLEVLVACVQAYVFTILTCVYLKDALHPSH